MPDILRQHPQLGLVIIGGGPQESRLYQEVVQLGLKRWVQFVGGQAHQEVIRYFHNCRVAVVPSITDQIGRTEGMPAVIAEALAAGARVVASAVGGIPDIIQHAHNGWLCKEKDPHDLAQKILTALAEPHDSPVLQRAQETAALLDWSVVAGALPADVCSGQHDER